jgi:hypothetical protein
MNKKKKNIVKSDDELTPMQEKFAGEMVNPETKNATQAAIKAGASQKTARSIASRWLTKANIRNAIERRRKEFAETSKITAEEVFGSVIREMLVSIDDVLGENGRFDIKKARRTGAIHYVREISFRETKFGTSISIKMADQSAARREIEDLLGMKQEPRENEKKFKDTIAAIRDYLESHPEKTLEEVAPVFSRGRGFPVEKILQELKSENN